MIGDGDGWVHCAAGHRHWGRFGAAGLLVTDGVRVILQHRAPWTHEGDTWGVPGGARDSHEDAPTAALREAAEEACIEAAAVQPFATWVEDHGGWSYTTVLARPRTAISPYAANAESNDVRWWMTAEVDRLPLHHGFALAWSHLRNHPAPLVIIVARADGPGQDSRDEHDSALSVGQLQALARYGVALPDLTQPSAQNRPPAWTELAAKPGNWALLPQVLVLGLDRARPPDRRVTPAPGSAPDGWWLASLSDQAIGSNLTATMFSAVADTIRRTPEALILTAIADAVSAPASRPTNDPTFELSSDRGRVQQMSPKWLGQLIDAAQLRRSPTPGSGPTVRFDPAAAPSFD